MKAIISPPFFLELPAIEGTVYSLNPSAHTLSHELGGWLPEDSGDSSFISRSVLKEVLLQLLQLSSTPLPILLSCLQRFSHAPHKHFYLQAIYCLKAYSLQTHTVNPFSELGLVVWLPGILLAD